MNRRPRLPVALFLSLLALPLAAQTPAPNAALIARAKALELDTRSEPPPGDPLEYHAAGLAKVICSAVFITGLDPDFAWENVGYFTAPYAERAKLGRPVIDRINRAVHVTLPNGVRRTAIIVGSQGAVALPRGADTVAFKPVTVRSALPDARTQPWPMGDVLPSPLVPSEIDAAKLRQAIDAAFAAPEGLTAALAITWKGRLIGERYAPGITAQTPLEYSATSSAGARSSRARSTSSTARSIVSKSPAASSAC